MKIWIDLVSAWIAVLLALLLSIIYILRTASGKKTTTLSLRLRKIDKRLRERHKLLGILLILTGFTHGLFSSQEILSLNIGTAAWLLSILLGANWLFRKHTKRIAGWISIHRIMTFMTVLAIILHIIDVGGIKAPGILFVKNTGSIGNGSSELKLYVDGTYTGEASGFRPGLKVSVLIEGGKIVEIKILDHNEKDPRYYSKALEQVPREIIDTQSTDVDTVSGATYTSRGIMKAVEDALSKAAVPS